uniref:Uncharacterized protein n=1 Tax=viral metagenome TaxID=1070528 RepID=A0A6M3IY13_9ZZZZ
MFDYNMILMDGSVSTTTALDTAATSVTRDATTGAAVIDLGVGGTPVSGLTAVLVLADDLADNSYTLTSYMEACDAVGFGSAVERLGNFGVANATEGIILDTETPCVATVRFATAKRYVRINATVSNTFGYIYVYLSPYVFKIL